MARAKQQHLPGMAPPSIPELDAAAENYDRVKNRRVKLTDEETEAQAVLLAAMKKHKLTVYEYDGKLVVLSATEKVRVKPKKDEEGGDDEE